MNLWQAPIDGSSIHLAVEASSGGSSLGIQMARQAISDGGRVLWASPELPNSTRFSQIFSGMELTASSRFHSMNLVGNIDQALASLSHTANVLPGVSLVILDDYCPNIGQIPKTIIDAVNKLISDSSWTTLLISKGGVSMDDSPLVARAKNKLKTDNLWLLTRPESNSKRVLWINDDPIDLLLVEDGFVN